MLASCLNSSYKPIDSRRAKNAASYFSSGHFTIRQLSSCTARYRSSISHFLLRQKTSSENGLLFSLCAKFLAAFIKYSKPWDPWAWLSHTKFCKANYLTFLLLSAIFSQSPLYIVVAFTLMYSMVDCRSYSFGIVSRASACTYHLAKRSS